jgi:hypothetical protein
VVRVETGQPPSLRNRAGSLARRVAQNRLARASVAPISVAVGGALLGYLDGAGHLDAVPAIGGSRMVTIGLAGYAATRWSRNATVRAAGYAALAAAAYDYGRLSGYDRVRDGRTGTGSGSSTP